MSIMSTRKGTIISVNISPGGIPKKPVEQCDVTFDGLAGDGHNHDKHNGPMMAVTLIDIEDLEDLKREGFDMYPGASGENITVRGLNVDELSIGDRLRATGGLDIEITKKRKPCYVLDEIDPQLKTAFVGRCGMIAKVITPAQLKTGEELELVQCASDE